MPWENTEQYIRSGHRGPEEFQKDTLKTITIDEKGGVKAVVGKPKGKDTVEIQSYLFSKDKDWTMEKAEEWFKKHQIPKKLEAVENIEKQTVKVMISEDEAENQSTKYWKKSCEVFASIRNFHCRSLKQKETRLLKRATTKISETTNQVYYSSQIKMNGSRLCYFDWDETRCLWFPLSN